MGGEKQVMLHRQKEEATLHGGRGGGEKQVMLHRQEERGHVT